DADVSIRVRGELALPAPRAVVSPQPPFFCAYRRRRDPHSFPTRRSSDLYAEEAGLFEKHGLDVELIGFDEENDVVRALISGDLEDRKSTRLNSSHVKISYAVFCLKKKKIAHADAELDDVDRAQGAADVHD